MNEPNIDEAACNTVVDPTNCTTIPVDGGKTLVEVQIQPCPAFVDVDGTWQFKLFAFYSDGTSEDVTESDDTTWQSVNETIATIDEDGLATGVLEGVTTVVATHQDKQAFCNIEVAQTCEDSGLDMVLAIGRNKQMNFLENGQQKIAYIRDAAKALIDIIDPEKDQIALASYAGIIYSNGEPAPPPSFEVANDLETTWSDINCDNDVGIKVLAVVYGGTIHVSSDYGATWTSKGSSRLYRACCLSATGLNQYAVAENGDIQLSVDSGATFMAGTAVPVPGLTPRVLAMDCSSDGATVYVAAQSSAGNFIFKSIDFATTWTEVYTDVLPTIQFKCIACDALGEIVYLADYNSQLLKSTDGGDTWARVGNIVGGNLLTVDCSNDGQKVVAGSINNVYTSVNGASVMALKKVVGTIVYDVCYSGDGNVVAFTTSIAGSAAGFIYKSNDDGDSWIQIGDSRQWFALGMDGVGCRKYVTVVAGETYRDNCASDPTETLKQGEATLDAGMGSDQDALKAIVDSAFSVRGPCNFPNETTGPNKRCERGLGTPLEVAYAEIDGPSHNPASNRLIILVTDGKDNIEDPNPLTVATEIKAEGILLAVIGIGITSSAFAALQAIATPGLFYNVQKASQVAEVLARLPNAVCNGYYGDPGYPDPDPDPDPCEGVDCPVAATLRGLRWELPCILQNGAGLCSCVDPPDQIAQLEGDPSATYAVELRFRGFVELWNYIGGSSSGYLQIGGAPAPNPHGYNIYSLEVSDPPQIFYLNRNPGNQGVVALDYEYTIQMKGTATVTLKARCIDGIQIRNIGNVVVSGVPPAPAAFNGQFIQMDVLSVEEV